MIFTEAPSDFNPAFEAVSCFVQCDDQVLLLLRAHREGKMEGGKWGIPAGRSEPNEDALATALRELEEETQIIALTADLEDFGSVFVRYPQIDFTFRMFGIRLKELPQVIISKEHSAYKWVPISELLSMDLVLDQDECFKVIFGELVSG